MIVLLSISLLILIYYFATRNHDYWSKRNVKHYYPVPFLGTHFRNQFGIISITELSIEMYNKFPNEKVVGYYRGRTPELIIRDLNIVKNILTVDFPYFYQRGLGRDPEVEPLMYNLFHVEGDIWRLLRQRLTAAFTTSKLKNMFPLIVNCAEKLQDVGKEIVSRGGDCDVRELMARFTTEFIGACGFGIEMNTINDEHSLFRDLGRKIFTRSWKSMFYFILWEMFPVVRKKIYVADPALEAGLREIVMKIREQRNYKPIGRNDFIDLLLELETNGIMTGESLEKRNPDGSPVQVELEMNLTMMIAQVLVFFAAGFETSSSATSYTLNQLAYHPEIQTKIQEEIDKVLAKYDNKLSYDAVADMHLLDCAFKEAMRIFPSLGVLSRVCCRKYSIPDLNITIDPGVRIVIPIQAIQNDEQYFDNPREFKPERFALNKKLNNNVYMPFGEGPRACIGERLGQMQSLAGLAAVLQKFTVVPSAASRRHPPVDPAINVVQSIKGGIPLKLELRNT